MLSYLKKMNRSICFGTSKSSRSRRIHTNLQQTLQLIADNEDSQITVPANEIPENVARNLECVAQTSQNYSNELSRGVSISDVDYFSDCDTVDATLLDEIPSLSDSDSEDVGISEPSLTEMLSNWAIHYGITLVAITALLAILKVYHPDLPKDARSLMKTKRTLVVKEKANGQYFYFGIVEAFRHVLEGLVSVVQERASLKLQINIDGLPLFKSSNMQLWPILGMMVGCKMKKTSSDSSFLWHQQT